jgi:hypothetical protein
VIHLGPGEVVAGRPFTALDHTTTDLRVMDWMLARLRRYMAEVVVPSEAGARDDRVIEPDGSQLRLAIPDVTAALEPRDVVAVGFFGQARMSVDHSPIIDLESALVADVDRESGLLVYQNVFWPGVGWGNLVLFDGWAAKDRWGRDDPRHVESILRSPAHYHSIRLHNGVVPGGLPGDSGVRLVRTRYLDYDGERPWRAVRELG